MNVVGNATGGDRVRLAAAGAISWAAMGFKKQLIKLVARRQSPRASSVLAVIQHRRRVHGVTHGALRLSLTDMNVLDKVKLAHRRIKMRPRGRLGAEEPNSVGSLQRTEWGRTLGHAWSPSDRL